MLSGAGQARQGCWRGQQARAGAGEGAGVGGEMWCAARQGASVTRGRSVGLVA